MEKMEPKSSTITKYWEGKIKKVQWYFSHLKGEFNNFDNVRLTDAPR